MFGAGAQEESLFRRTNYHEFLDGEEKDYLYPLPEVGGVYSSNVLVFRSNEEKGYRFIRPIFLSFIAATAIKNPNVIHGHYSPEHALLMKKKIGAILSIALHHGHDSIVLGAFGCGSYQNPPQAVAEAIREVLSYFAGQFHTVTFAILGGQGSIDAFTHVFRQH